WRCVEIRPFAWRCAIRFCTWSSSSARPAASPSITTPMASPWLSPNSVTCMLFPKLFFMSSSFQHFLDFFIGDRFQLSRSQRLHLYDGDAVMSGFFIRQQPLVDILFVIWGIDRHVQLFQYADRP